MAKTYVLQALAELINRIEWLENIESCNKLEKSLLVESARKALEKARSLEVK